MGLARVTIMGVNPLRRRPAAAQAPATEKITVSRRMATIGTSALVAMRLRRPAASKPQMLTSAPPDGVAAASTPYGERSYRYSPVPVSGGRAAA
jgi:hypothetical protein